MDSEFAATRNLTLLSYSQLLSLSLQLICAGMMFWHYVLGLGLRARGLALECAKNLEDSCFMMLKV